MDELDDVDVSARPVQASDVEDIVREVSDTDTGAKWLTDVELHLGAKRWRPSAVSEDGKRLLYVGMHDEFPRFAIERLRLAKEAGLAIAIALPIGSLFQPDIIEILVEVDSDVFVIDDYRQERRFKSRHFLAAMADIEVPLAPEIRRTIGTKIWGRIGEGTNHEKGRRLEALLAFVFSQIRDLKVVERNYRNESEEIDLVLQVDNFSPRVWQNPGVPFVLVEAKNRADKATQQMMSALLTKLQTKRGTARIGIMVSLAGFTEDAKLQELRFSTQEICVVMIDRDGLESLLLAEDIDEELETMVRRSLLR